MMLSYSWHRPPDRGSSCSLRETAPSPESERWSTPCPAQTHLQSHPRSELNILYCVECDINMFPVPQTGLSLAQIRNVTCRNKKHWADLPAVLESWPCALWSFHFHRGQWCPQSQAERDQQPASAGSAFKNNNRNISSTATTKQSAIWAEWRLTCRPRSETEAAWRGCSSLQSGPREGILTALWNKPTFNVLPINKDVSVVDVDYLFTQDIIYGTYQQIEDPGRQGFESRETQPQVFQQADQYFDSKDQTWNKPSSSELICIVTVKADQVKYDFSSRWLRGVLLKPASMTDGSEGTLQHLDVHWGDKKQKTFLFFKQPQCYTFVPRLAHCAHLCLQTRSKVSQCSSGSSLRRLGGTVVMRIFTVASAELISKPVSLVNMDSTERRSQTLCQARFTAARLRSTWL